MLIWPKSTRNRLCLSKSTTLGVLFCFETYLSLFVFRENNIVMRVTSSETEELTSSTRYAQTGWEQFKACLWKQHLSYWRNPSYNLTRILFMCLNSVICGVLFWQKAKKMLLSCLSTFFKFVFSQTLCFIFLLWQKHSTRSFQCIGINVHGGSFHWNKQLLYRIILHCNRTKCLLPRKICSNVQLMGLLPCTG